MLGSPAGPGGPTQRGLWPLAPAPAPSATSFTADAYGKYGLYSLFPGGPAFGSALYSHASAIGRFASSHIQPSSGSPFHTHKDSLFSPTGYTFGAPTPPPGSPYSPIPVAQLELLAKGFNSNIIIQQPDYHPVSPKKAQLQEKRCDEKCCNLKPQKQQCGCHHSPSKTKFVDNTSGCSRTNPVDWNHPINVKKEPNATPCQVAEITTSVSPIVKVEITSPTQKHSDVQIAAVPPIVTTNGNIPVGIAVARQRIQQHEAIGSPSLPPAGLLTTVNASSQLLKDVSRMPELEPTPGMAANTTGGVPGGGTLLQCATDDRGTGLSGWPMGGTQNSALATPTLWQYPAAPLPVEPMVPVPMPPVGFQLVRDPSGSLLLLPTTTGIEHLQQAMVWPSYPQPSSHVLLPSIPPPPLQLLSSASSDYLSTSTTLHQHTQTHSTRLVAVTTDAKRKIPLPVPATALIKIETDASSLDQTKTLQASNAISGSYADQGMPPLLTTHVIYQHPTNLILSSQTPTEMSCRSQATSPVTCLTPPPESTPPIEEELLGVQDASNQTETPIYSEDDSIAHALAEAAEAKSKLPEEPQQQESEAEESTKVPENQSETTVPLEPQSTTPPEQSQSEAIKPDLSGLELLSNSIVEFENCIKNNNNININNNSKIPVKQDKDEITSNGRGDEVLRGIADMTLKDDSENIVIEKAVDDNLVGLDLLCALAEQRIMEEVDGEKSKKSKEERRKEKRKSKKHSEEPRRKKIKSTHEDEEKERVRNKNQFETEYYRVVGKDEDGESRCSCREDKYRSYKTPESEEEVRKFIASKSQPNCCKGDWPCMNAMELDMRMRLADLQRQYREKQLELSKLKPKKHSSDCSNNKKNRSRKKSTSSTPPPLLDKMDIPLRPNIRSGHELLKPPTLCAFGDSVKISDPIKPHEHGNTHKRHPSPSTVDLIDTPIEREKKSSSKKRKVGRPKKLLSSPGLHITTETIVAKKPKKGSLVGYLLAAKEKLQMQHKNGLVYASSPPRYVEEASKNKHKHKTNTKKTEKTSKIRPKLKAEPTIKTYCEEEEIEEYEEEPFEEEAIAQDSEQENEQENSQEEVDIEIVPNEVEGEKEQHEQHVEEEISPKPTDSRCILTAQHLENGKMRVLTAMGGLFYAGHLNAVEPPDVYSITLDGERGNRPHIMSREEILRDAIVEVAPSSTEELATGTRLCAYWSQQYRCLYPGSVAEPGTPDPALDSKFVSVEFDDGDSGRIALEDIRLLPPDYPIIEYDPNPLLSLSKRRRRTSTSVSTEERKITPPNSVVAVPLQDIPEERDMEVEKENKDANRPDLYREKKRLKKRKRDKLKQRLLHDDKKHRKKHKCLEEHCKHRKHHKKHRKHKKHHHSKELPGEEEEKKEEQAVVENDENEEEAEEQEDCFPDTTETEDYPEYQIIPNPEDEVTMDDIIEADKSKKSKKLRDRQESCESRSKMSAFLPARQLWGWSGKGYKRPRAKGRSRKQFFKAIQRGKESITVGDSAVFLSTGRPDRPYIGRIEAMWELCGTMVVKVKWFYHPEETVGCPLNLQYPGALFESPHVDENDVQTISHKCEVLPLKDYTEKLGDDPQRYASIYDNNDIYYLAGHYDPTTTTLKMEPGIPFTKTNNNNN